MLFTPLCTSIFQIIGNVFQMLSLCTFNLVQEVGAQRSHFTFSLNIFQMIVLAENVHKIVLEHNCGAQVGQLAGGGTAHTENTVAHTECMQRMHRWQCTQQHAHSAPHIWNIAHISQAVGREVTGGQGSCANTETWGSDGWSGTLAKCTSQCKSQLCYTGHCTAVTQD